MVVVSGGQLHFHKWGAGERLLIALHGFEGDGAWFAPLGALLPSNTCLYAPDLPWHGRTQWHKASFSTSDFVEMVDALRTHAGIADYTAIGFSLGARLWMGSLSALAPGRMRKLVLLAPDGLASRWDKGFSLLYAAVGQSRLERWLRQPKPLFRLAARLRYWGLLPAYAPRFLERNLGSPAKVHRLLNTWDLAGQFESGFPLLAEAARTLPVVVAVGLKDPLLHTKKIQRECARAGIPCLAFAQAGHALPLQPTLWVGLLWA
jgi:pimeloyl-ACP methyl ester carboxylesterase